MPVGNCVSELALGVLQASYLCYHCKGIHVLYLAIWHFILMLCLPGWLPGGVSAGAKGYNPGTDHPGDISRVLPASVGMLCDVWMGPVCCPTADYVESSILLLVDQGT
mgnify:CR=1 FL=1